MPITFDDIRNLYLAGTVHFPPKPPRLAEITIEEFAFPSGPKAVMTLCETHDADEDVNILRRVLLEDVSAVFIPQDTTKVILYQGCWFVGPDIQDFEKAQANLGGIGTQPVQGIVFLPEHVAMTVASGAMTSCGCTAGEANERHKSMIAYLGCC